MIKLEVEDYCHSCECFETETVGPVTKIPICGGELWVGDTIIRCANQSRCKNIRAYLERRNEILKGEKHE